MDISLFMSAARPKLWKRMCESLIANDCDWELVAVGPNPPICELPDNFRWFYSDKKPTQCYAAGSYFSDGELMGWTADDAIYPPHSLDKIWESYKAYGSGIIYAQHTIENGKDVTREHRFIRHDESTPRMAPMAFINRRWFWKLGGYDRNFVSGQAENDIVMRAYQDNGDIRVDPSEVYLNHEEAHGGIINKLKFKLGKNSFRSGYWDDRRYLEECWVLNNVISPFRHLPVHPFYYNNILTVAQGPQGRFSHEKR